MKNGGDVKGTLTVVKSGVTWGGNSRTITLTPASGSAITTTASSTTNVLSFTATGVTLTGDVEYTVSWS